MNVDFRDAVSLQLRNVFPGQTGSSDSLQQSILHSHDFAHAGERGRRAHHQKWSELGSFTKIIYVTKRLLFALLVMQMCYLCFTEQVEEESVPSGEKRKKVGEDMVNYIFRV